MAQDDDILKVLHSLNPVSVTIDQWGRIVIKDPVALKKIEDIQTQNNAPVVGPFCNCINCGC